MMTVNLNLDGSDVCSFKTRKSQGLPLSSNSSQLSNWAHKCYFCALKALIEVSPLSDEVNCEKTGDLKTPSSLLTALDV